MKVTLPPIYHEEGYSTPVEAQLVAYLRAVLFDPLEDMLPESAGLRLNVQAVKEDDTSDVWAALLLGTLWYSKGVFSGQFSAAISRSLRAMGARRVGSGFYLAEADLPIAVRGAIAVSAARAQEMHRAVIAFLDSAEGNLSTAPTGINLTEEVDTLADNLQEQLVRSFSGVEELAPPAPVSPVLREELRESITSGVNRAIRGFTEETIQNLRARVQANLSRGARVDHLAKIIETEFGVARRHARFIADQETSLLVSKFRETRYRELGSTEYVWDDSHDAKVRPDHRALNGRTFSWDAPPITDTATGARNHPGEDFNCRCVARPRFSVARVRAAA